MLKIRTLRRVSAAAAALAAALLVSSCSSSGASVAGTGSTSVAPSSTAVSAGPWSYTDDTGRTVTLDQRPARVASYSDYAIGLLSYDIAPVAVFGRADVKTDARFADYDLSDIAVVGNNYGEIDLEALADTQPALIVVGIYPTDRQGTLDLQGAYYGVADVEQQKQLEAIAPVVAIKVGGRGIDVIGSLNRLALALGAQQSTVDAAKAQFDTAAADLQAAAGASDLEVTQMYADADGIYVAKPSDEPEMELYRSYGVTFTDLHPDGDYYWDIYSWENAAQMMTGDVLLVNVQGFGKDDLLAQATFASSPALQAGQFHAWNQAALDYASQARHMTELAEILRSSKPV